MLDPARALRRVEGSSVDRESTGKGAMANVNMPAPVALAGAALCLLGGYVVGAALGGQDTAGLTTAEVESFDERSNELCLTGDAVADLPGAADGTLCGTWRSSQRVRVPQAGDEFRFVSLRRERSGGDDAVTFIYGDVVR
jgi:hypothetical protein